MNITEAHNRFAVRLYEWSFKDLLREMEEGCPLLSNLGLYNRRVAAFVAWNETLTLKERFAVATALTRRSHENAVKLKGEALTGADKRWNQVFHEETTRHMGLLPPLTSADKQNPDFRPADAATSLAILAEFISPAMGKVTVHSAKLSCLRSLGQWKLLTDFLFDKREESLSFEYQFIRTDGKRVRTGHPGQGPFPRTLLMFYGIYTSTAFVPSALDSEPVARAITTLAEHFLSQADPLFDGLGVKD